MERSNRPIDRKGQGRQGARSSWRSWEVTNGEGDGVRSPDGRTSTAGAGKTEQKAPRSGFWETALEEFLGKSETSFDSSTAKPQDAKTRGNDSLLQAPSGERVRTDSAVAHQGSDRPLRYASPQGSRFPGLISPAAAAAAPALSHPVSLPVPKLVDSEVSARAAAPANGTKTNGVGAHGDPARCAVCGSERVKQIVWSAAGPGDEGAQWSVCRACGLTFIGAPVDDAALHHRACTIRRRILKNSLRPLLADLADDSLSAVVGLDSDLVGSAGWFGKRNVVWVPNASELPAERYNLVAFPLTLECEEQPVRALMRACSFLAPSGLICLTVYDARPWRRAVLGRGWSGFTLPNQRVTFDLECLHRMLKLAGLSAAPVREAARQPEREAPEDSHEPAKAARAKQISCADWLFSPRLSWQRLSNSVASVSARPA